MCSSFPLEFCTKSCQWRRDSEILRSAPSIWSRNHISQCRQVAIQTRVRVTRWVSHYCRRILIFVLWVYLLLLLLYALVFRFRALLGCVFALQFLASLALYPTSVQGLLALGFAYCVCVCMCVCVLCVEVRGGPYIVWASRFNVLQKVPSAYRMASYWKIYALVKSSPFSLKTLFVLSASSFPHHCLFSSSY